MSIFVHDKIGKVAMPYELIDMIQKNGLANIIHVKNFVSEDSVTNTVDRSKKQTGRKPEPL